MNTAKIAALYGTYSNLHLLPLTAPLRQQVAELLESKAQRASKDFTDGPRYHIALKDMGAKLRLSPTGKRLHNEVEIYCPQRVHDWARAQQPATDRHQRLPEAEIWSAMTSSFPETGEGEFTLRFGAKEDFALLLRGVRAYERKQQKRYRKLLAQLRAYHTQQLAAEALRATMQAATPAEPLLPTYGITYAEYWRRVKAAEDLGEQFDKQSNGLSSSLNSEILWHPDFLTGCVRSFSRLPLCEVEAFLSNNLAEDFNVGRPLDRADYLYLVDCLREGLADSPTPLAALRLARALAWVEQASEALLPTAQPHLTAAPFEATPALAA